MTSRALIVVIVSLVLLSPLKLLADDTVTGFLRDESRMPSRVIKGHKVFLQLEPGDPRLPEDVLFDWAESSSCYDCDPGYDVTMAVTHVPGSGKKNGLFQVVCVNGCGANNCSFDIVRLKNGKLVSLLEGGGVSAKVSGSWNGKSLLFYGRHITAFSAASVYILENDELRFIVDITSDIVGYSFYSDRADWLIQKCHDVNSIQCTSYLIDNLTRYIWEVSYGSYTNAARIYLVPLEISPMSESALNITTHFGMERDKDCSSTLAVAWRLSDTSWGIIEKHEKKLRKALKSLGDRPPKGCPKLDDAGGRRSGWAEAISFGEDDTLVRTRWLLDGDSPYFCGREKCPANSKSGDLATCPCSCFCPHPVPDPSPSLSLSPPLHLLKFLGQACKSLSGVGEHHHCVWILKQFVSYSCKTCA